jgi:ATP-dependent Clp protease ATP-binding subunit ClpA
MFERFTDQARRVVVQAQEEARALGHSYIGTEHILLGLLSEPEGLAAQALSSLEIGLNAAREQVVEIVGQGSGQQGGHIPFTPRTKKVLELSLREAQRLGDDHIGTEHILLGLVREGDDVGAQILVRLGAGLDRVQEQVLATVRTAPAEELQRVSVGRMPGGSMSPSVTLRAVMSRLDEIAKRLTAIENLLAGRQAPEAGAAPKPASAGAGEPAPGGTGEPASGGAGEPAPGGAQRNLPAGETEPPVQQQPPGEPEPPAAEA